jgi:hypothetical protein
MDISRKFVLVLLGSTVLLSGCSAIGLSALLPGPKADPKDYSAYTKAQVEIAKTAAAAETARIQALAEIAKSGSDVSKALATQAIEKGTQPIKVEIVPPKK